MGKDQEGKAPMRYTMPIQCSMEVNPRQPGRGSKQAWLTSLEQLPLELDWGRRCQSRKQAAGQAAVRLYHPQRQLSSSKQSFVKALPS